MIDIVIPVYSQFPLLKKCLDSLKEAFSDFPYKVYVYDNNSPEDYKTKKEFYGQFDVSVSMGSQNVGFPRACNSSAARGRNSYILFLNSDAYLIPGSGNNLIRHMEEDESIGVLGMKLLFPTDIFGEAAASRPADKVQHYGISFDINAMPHHVFIGWSKDNPKVCVPIEPAAVTGAALMTRRKIFNRVKGFDLDYGNGTYEDVAYCMAVKQEEYRIMIFPDCIGYHYANASITPQTQFPLEINRQIFYNRWMGKGIIWTDGDLL
jgi:GT2 family glycosyltransferase